MSRPTYIGSAKVFAESLAPKASQEGTATGPVVKLELLQGKEVTGHIFLQGLLVQTRLRDDRGQELSRVDEEIFEGNIERLGVSGGSAAFFKLSLRQTDRPHDYFIGKDLSHAEDEVGRLRCAGRRFRSPSTRRCWR